MCVCVCSLSGYGTAKEGESEKQKGAECNKQRRREVEFVNRRSRRSFVLSFEPNRAFFVCVFLCEEERKKEKRNAKW